jgi:lysophospholipase L1-like esterase
MKNCLIFGDSITQGFFAVDNWVARIIAEKLKINPIKRPPVFVNNLGVAGNTTFDLIKRMEFDIKARNFFDDLTIVIAIGINDTKLMNGNDSPIIKKEDFENNINNIFNIAKKYTDKIIFVGLTYVDEEKTNPCFWEKEKAYQNKFVKEYDNIIESFCNKNNVDYICLYDKTKDKNLLFDGLHPNSNGHKIIYEEVRKKLNNYI